jgi:hypothetical protein
MEKRRKGFLSDDDGALTAIAADSVETLSALARRMSGMAHPEFGHMGAFAHPGRFAQCLQRWGRGSVPTSVLEASPPRALRGHRASSVPRPRRASAG